MVTRETSISDGLSELGLPAPAHVVRRLAELAEILAKEAVALGFIGPAEANRIVPRHILEAAALYCHLPETERIADVGSGAGLPGLVLAALGADVVLIEAQRKRAEFLVAVSRELGLAAEVWPQRAEDVGRGLGRGSFGVVTARALAIPPVALELCLPLAKVSGVCALLTTRRPTSDDGCTSGGSEVHEGDDKHGPAGMRPHDDFPPNASTGTEMDHPGSRGGAGAGSSALRTDALAAAPGDDAPVTRDRASNPASENDIDVVSRLLGGEAPQWIELSVPGATAPRWVMMVRKVRPTPDRFPRRAGVPKKRPLGGDVASVH